MDTQLTSLTWPSPAKLNLFLYITGRRADGYHTLQTLFQFLDYGDSVTITPRTDGEIRLLTPLAGVPDEQNLVIRAARLLQIYAREHHLTADLPVRILPLKNSADGRWYRWRFLQCCHSAYRSQLSLEVTVTRRNACRAGCDARCGCPVLSRATRQLLKE